MTLRVEDYWDRPLREAMGAIHERLMHRTTYGGVRTYKWPADLWSYQEIMAECLPEAVIEIGTKFGGSALWLADTLCALSIGRSHECRVLTVDRDHSIVHRAARRDDRIAFIEGDATEPAVVEYVHTWVAHCKFQRVMVIEDSAHTYEVTKGCLEAYGDLVGAGQYFVVEDALMCKAHNRGARGPWGAVQDFVAASAGSWVVDRDREWPVTCNAGGYLRRV